MAVARHARQRDILVASSRGCRAYRACRRGRYEDATRKLLPWNFSFTGERSTPARSANAIPAQRSSGRGRHLGKSGGHLKRRAETDHSLTSACPSGDRWLTTVTPIHWLLLSSPGRRAVYITVKHTHTHTRLSTVYKQRAAARTPCI